MASADARAIQQNARRAGTKTTLVIDGTGRAGRRVAERLTAQGLPARVGSRSGEPPVDTSADADAQRCPEVLPVPGRVPAATGRR
ncbi:hypothetical protein [Streptomyces sp. NPDC018000]|uniref:hypothetical protein n=1 Tax=Streptomyces sp. NPDC018000 TaxID=3365028 RepID=UPI0037921116